MKKLLSMLLAIIMLVAAVTVAGAATVNPFTDVHEDAWYYEEVLEAVRTGIINGKTETEFKPDDFLTYAEAIKLAACINQVHINGKVTLEAGNPWYMPYVEFCQKNGIISKEYNYNANITRAEYIEIFACALPDESYREINDIPDGSILDVDMKAPYAIYVYKMYRAGIVTGVDEKRNCNPDANIKRSEVATIISRIMNEEKRVEFEMPESKGIIKNEETLEDDDPGIVNNAEVKVNKPADDPIITDTGQHRKTGY